MTEESTPDVAALVRRIDALEAQVGALREQVRLARPVHWAGSEGVIEGEGARVHPTSKIFATEGRTVRIGDRTLIRKGAEIVGPVTIGDGCSFNRDVYIRANVTFGKNCNIGAFSRFITDSHEIAGPSRRAGAWSFPPITVGDGTFIGTGVVVLGGVAIGTGCVIAAGSVVTKDVPANTLVGGVPAKVIRALDGDSTVTAQ